MAVKAFSLATVVAMVVVALVVMGRPSPLAASGMLQSSSEAPEIAEPECSFWLDHDNDGEGNEPFNPELDAYVLQETPIIGGCSFKLSAPDEATIVVASELKDWEVEVELKRESGPTEDFRMYLGRTEIPGVKGSMRVTANFTKGETPRSGKSRTLTDGYRYEAQIPEEFRLIAITVTTPDGRKDRLEQNAQSASGAYTSVHRLLSDRKTELPERVVTLAEAWLEEGYPQVADSIITLESASADAVDGSINWWKWIAISTWVGFGVLIIVGMIIVIRSNRTPRTPTTPTPRRPL